MVFAIALIFPQFRWYEIALLFGSAVFIDVDHYLNAVYKTGSWNFKGALKYYKELSEKEQASRFEVIKKKGDFHFLHTIELHIAVLVLAIFFRPFWFILAGMIFHSLLDFGSLSYQRRLYRREYFFFDWLKYRKQY
jgi:hypothetical protein